MSRHFIIIGAQRSGTTLLYRLLDAHPDIFMARPERPEPKYFLRSHRPVGDRAGYERLFSDAGDRLRGEKSTSYIESAVAARRIAETLPDVRLVVMLRDPVERAISNYWFSVNHGVEPLDLDEALRHEEERRESFDRGRFSVSPFAYLQRGLYADQLDAYRRYFPRSQMKLLVFEKLVLGRQDLGDLFRYLGVSADESVQWPRQPVNASRRNGGEVLDPALRRELEDYFAEPNRRLASEYDVDVSHWPGTTRT